MHPHDVAPGARHAAAIAVRAGHHCAKPAHARFGVQSSTRMSSYLYTTPAEIDALVEGLDYTRDVLQGELSHDRRAGRLYQEIILDHYKHPHHQGLREPFEAEVHHVNPTCGDEVTLRVHLSGRRHGRRGRVLRRAWAARSRRPSTSVLTDLVIGKPVDRGDVDPRDVPDPDAGQGAGRARRGRARGRHRLRRRRQVPRPRQVRPAVLDGLEGRHRCRARRAGRDRGGARDRTRPQRPARGRPEAGRRRRHRHRRRRHRGDEGRRRPRARHQRRRPRPGLRRAPRRGAPTSSST